MNLNEVINKRFICSYDVFKKYQILKQNGKTYKLSNTIEKFIEDNSLNPIYVKKDLVINTFAVKSLRNEPAISLNGTTFKASYIRDIYILLVEDNSHKVLESFIYYVDPRIGSNNNMFTPSDVISVNSYSSYSPDLISRTIQSNNGTIAKIYGFFINDYLKYFDINKSDINSSSFSTPSSIGYKLFLDGENKLGIDVSDKTDLYKFVIEEDYSKDSDGSIKIEENNNTLYKNIDIADDNYLPVGSIISVIKYNDKVNSSIKNNYLKMDGSEIPDKPIYKNLRNLLKGSDYLNRLLNETINKLEYKIINPENLKAVWFIKEQSILDYVRNSNHNNGVSLTGSESVTINERYWDGFNITNFNSTNVLSSITRIIGNNQRAVLDGNSLSKLVNSDLFTLGNYYKNDRTNGITSTSFSVSDVISVGYAQNSGNNAYYTIYNHTTNTYMISGASNMYCDGIGFLHRNYDSKILIAQIGSDKYLFLGAGLSTSSDSNFNKTTVYDFNGNVYSYDVNDKIYLPDMTEESVFIGGGKTPGSYILSSIPNITSRCGNTYEDYNNGHSYAMNMSGEAYSNGVGPNGKGCSMGPGWEGAFYAEAEKPNDVGFQNGLNFYATNQSVADGNYWQLYLKFDASRSNPVYGRTDNLNPNYYVVEYWIKYK